MLADLPGLIEGAHEGIGLGDRFLGHTERCRVLLHLIDGTVEDAGEAYKTVRAELEAYGQGLTDKPEIVALSKADALTPEAIKTQSARLKKACKTTPLVLSAQSGKGVPEALRALRKVIDAAREDADQPQAKKRPGSLDALEVRHDRLIVRRRLLDSPRRGGAPAQRRNAGVAGRLIDDAVAHLLIDE